MDKWMDRWLVSVVEVWRVPTEDAAADLIADCQASNDYEIKGTSTAKKNTKVNKEIVDEWIEVKVTKIFNNPKEPENTLKPKYR